MNDKQKRARAYLEQSRRQEGKIMVISERIARYRSLAETAPSPSFDGTSKTQRSSDAPFVKILELIAELEDELERELTVLLDLDKQINSCLERLTEPNHALVLAYRYMDGLSWKQIAIKLDVACATVRRWHCDALELFKLPISPIEIQVLITNEHK